jgi:peptide methionine sulfoxide reductase MsrB
MSYENISILEEKHGRVVLDSHTGSETIIEYNRDGDYHCLCECGNRALLDLETDTYKCGCGWESACVSDNPDMFIDLENVEGDK